MIETISLFPGVTLRACRDTRFKQGCLSFQLVRQMDPEEAALNALLPSVLLRGTRRCPDLKSITEHLDALYGASVSPLVRRVGDYQTTGTTAALWTTGLPCREIRCCSPCCIPGGAAAGFSPGRGGISGFLCGEREEEPHRHHRIRAER